jgi:hypothetical protein
MTVLLGLRRGVGALYVLSGVAHWALMALAVSSATGAFDVRISAARWSQLYYGQYMLLIVAGPLYLWLRFRQIGYFVPAVLIDYVVGIPPFVVLMSVILPFLAAGGARFMAFAPGAFLVAYGAGLLSGRAIGFRKKQEF